MTEPHERKYQLISLSGGGYRAALYNAGVLRAFDVADSLHRPDLIVNSVSGGTIPTMIWREFLRSGQKSRDDPWPEHTLLDLVLSSPTFGGPINWHIQWAVWSIIASLYLGYASFQYLDNCCIAIIVSFIALIALIWHAGGEARRKWTKFLDAWWTRHRLEPSPLGLNPFFTIEALDYLSGSSWMYDNECLVPATRHNFKTRSPFDRIPMSVPRAIATATAFPPLFPGTKIPDGKNGKDVYLFKDAGVIDNVAMLPLLRIMERVPPLGERLGGVDFWFISDAGAPMPIPDSAALSAQGNTRVAKSVGLLDHIFRLTGNLAQPRFVKAITDMLEGYAGIRTMFIGIGVSIPEGESPWIAAFSSKELEPADVGTSLAGMSRNQALRILSEGAQAASAVLVREGMMLPAKRQELKQFIDRLKALPS